MKFIVKLICCAMLVNCPAMGFAQKHTQMVHVKILLPAVNVSDKKELELRVTIRNSSDTTLKVYKKLEEGHLLDRFANFRLVIEKKEGKKFKTFENRSFYDRAPPLDTSEGSNLFIPKVDDIDRVNLSAGDSIVFHYHLDNVYAFGKGAYRVKCVYVNNILKDDKVASNWIYFNILKPIYTTKYYDD